MVDRVHRGTGRTRAAEPSRLRLPESRVLLAVAGACGLATLAVAVAPGVPFAYREPALRATLETSAALVGLLAAFLAFGRHRRSGELSDLGLAVGLGVLALGNLVFGAIPASLAEAGAGRFSTWSASTSSLVGALLLSAAPFLPAGRLRRVELAERAALVLAAVLLAAIAAAVGALQGWLPSGVEPELTPEHSTRPQLVGHPAVLGMQLAGFAAFGAAAWGFGRRARRTGDGFLAWIAAAAVIAAFARLNYFLYPSAHSPWVHVGDVFRVLFYLVVLAAAAVEIGFYWRRLADLAVLDERRRIARDLHDGLAQEVAFIVRNTRRLDGDDVVVGRIASAATRALEESRRAIDALTRPLDEPFETTLARALEETASRVGTRVALALDADVSATAEQREALVRIACEATANAARHGGAPVVRVRLENGRRLRLSVSDEGRGFDPEAVTPTAESGFGLVSMRERAAAIGAAFTLRSRPGAGTTVEVEL